MRSPAEDLQNLPWPSFLHSCSRVLTIAGGCLNSESRSTHIKKRSCLIKPELIKVKARPSHVWPGFLNIGQPSLNCESRFLNSTERSLNSEPLFLNIRDAFSIVGQAFLMFSKRFLILGKAFVI